MTTLRDRLADALFSGLVDCGIDYRAVAEHQADVLLALDGIAVIDAIQGPDLIKRLWHFHDGGTVENPRALIREAIAALLAAADAAEGQQ